MPGGKIAIPLSRLGSVHPESVQELTAVQELGEGPGTAGFTPVPESHLPGQMWRDDLCAL